MSELADLPGAPESRLGPDALGLLPDATAAPPWRCRVEAVLWWHRAGPAAVAALPPPLRGRVRLPLVVGAVVRYLDSPVGPYDEVLGAVLYRPLRAHVPFLAVDSPASVHGGRAHWALPKTLAAFERDTGAADGDAQDGSAQDVSAQDVGAAHAGVVAQGPGWRIAATARPRGPQLPALGLLTLDQVVAGQLRSARVHARGRARVGRVVVQVGTDLAGRPGSIAGWLRSGRHPGVVLSGRLRVGRAL